jgi:hypothetical protein
MISWGADFALGCNRFGSLSSTTAASSEERSSSRLLPRTLLRLPCKILEPVPGGGQWADIVPRYVRGIGTGCSTTAPWRPPYGAVPLTSGGHRGVKVLQWRHCNHDARAVDDFKCATVATVSNSGSVLLKDGAPESEIRTGQQLRHCSEFLSRFARWMPAAGPVVPGGILAPDRVAWIRRTAAGSFVSIVSKVVAIVIVRIEPSLLANLAIFAFRCFCPGDTRAARQHQHTDSQCNPEHRGLLELVEGISGRCSTGPAILLSLCRRLVSSQVREPGRSFR